MKHLVTSGCSFTISDAVKIGTRNRSWAWALHDNLNSKITSFHNTGLSGGGNYIISMNCIDTVQCLLDDGISPDEIYVIVQWSGLFRPSVYTETKNERRITFDELNSDYTNYKNIDNNKGYFIDTAGQFNRNNPLWQTYFEHYFSLPSAFIHTLDMILRTQWYLKSKNIKYKMFNAWDIFTTYDETIKKFGSDKILNTSQFSNEIYISKYNTLLKDIYPYSKPLWNKIDWNHFWTFNNNNVQYGGMMQWIQNNLTFKDWYVTYPNDVHAPSDTGKIFMEQVILPLIGEDNEKNN